MKFTLGWLKEHLDTAAPLEKIVETLTQVGLEVEGVEDRAALYAPFAVARIEKAEKHPDADRLKVCIVDTGKEKLQVVCGAPNARAGMKGVFAPAGSDIPGTGITLKKGMIRGQESCGMMVSEREMGLSDEHEGIIDVTDRDPPLGTPFAALYGLDDPVIEIALTPNRADCTGIRGIARDLATAGIGTLKELDLRPVAGAFKSPVGVTLALKGEEASACPLFVGCYIRGVKNGPSPDWMQSRLKAVGLRPISALVDITNYMSVCLGRPLHVFDAKKLRGDIHVRLACKGEKLEALNDRTYELDDFMTVVCDDSGVLGLGGVIGGVSSGCTGETVDVFLEVAWFDPMRTARTGRALQVATDARYRFERGVDPDFVIPAAEYATRLILDLCGGEASEPVQAGAPPQWRRTIPFDPARTQKLAGVSVPAAEQEAILTRLGFTVKDGAAQPPSWRADIEGPADLVEEIARIHGFARIEPVSLPPLRAVTASAETQGLAVSRRMRTALAARGLHECVTWSFMAAPLAESFGANDARQDAALRIANPINAEQDRMRPSILPNLIEAAGRNRDRGYPRAALFEVGPVYADATPDGQQTVAAGIRCGAAGPKHWSGEQASRPVDLYDAKADALAVLDACGAPVKNLQTDRAAPSWYHPGRSGVLRLGPSILACFGEIHPALLEKMGIREKVCAFEVFPAAFPPVKKKPGTAKPPLSLSLFQPVERDFAFIVDASVEAESLVRAVQSADKALVETVMVFDVYTGPGVERGSKSIALCVTLQPREKTLTDEEIEAVCRKIVAAVASRTGGSLRA